jgi:hypothetical protein
MARVVPTPRPALPYGLFYPNHCDAAGKGSVIAHSNRSFAVGRQTMMTPLAIAGTPFTIVDCDWPDDLVQRFLDIVGRFWSRMPPLARMMFKWHVSARGGPVIRLVTDRGRWGGRYGWAAFNPKDGNLWFHASAFAHIPDALAVESGVAHELAHGLLFVLGEQRHVSGSGHPGREWLVEEVLERWGYSARPPPGCSG